MTTDASILVIEHDALQRATACAILRAAGWTVEAVDSSKEAFAGLTRQSFRLVMLDLDLPGQNALDVVPRLRQAHRGDGALHLLACSALRSVDLARRVSEAGLDGLLAKPLRADTVIPAVDRLLDATPTATLRLMDLFGAARFAELLRGLDAQLAEAPSALAGPDAGGVAHRLGGLAGTLGFATLAKALLVGEGTVESCPATMLALIERTRGQIQQLLGKRGVP